MPGRVTLPQSLLEAPDYSALKDKFLAYNCRNCRLCEGRTNLVFDRGNPLAHILIIGEAPGADEDKAGASFVGRSGKLLDKIMASIGLDTNRDALIANVVKCRPPDNRPPQKDEVESCRPFLLSQIATVQPKILVLLGATAFRHVFLPEKSFKGMAGAVGTISERRLLEENEVSVHPSLDKTFTTMVLYHPAYLLYDPRKRKEMWAHVQALRAWLEKEDLLPAGAGKPAPPDGPQPF